MSKSAKSKFLNAMGMREESSWLVRRLSPSLDTIRSVPADPPHACLQGLVRMSQNILINYILNADQHGAYSKAFSTCPMPPGWKRIQNPIRHRGSWDLSEQARACVITAIVLRTWLSDAKMRPEVIAAVKNDPQSPPFTGLITASAIITSIFCQMACAYGYVTRHQLNGEELDLMYDYTIESRRQFVRLISIVVSASKKTRATAATSECGTEAFEDPEDRPADNSTLGRYSETSNTRLPVQKLANWSKRSNVHIAKHYKMAASQYTTLFNIMVLPGERYHRLFKKWVVATNHQQVELQLLKKDARFKTVRSILHGAFSNSHPWVTKALSTLLQSCPTVMESFLPPSSHAFLDEEEEETEFSSIGDHNHIRPRVLGRITRRQAEALSLPSKPSQNQWFETQLRCAYSRDYNRPNIYEFGRSTIRYWKKMTFVSGDLEERLGYTYGTYIQSSSEGSYGTIQNIFTHELGGIDSVFAVVRKLNSLPHKDWLSNLPLMQESVEKTILGLPAIVPKRPYIISTKGDFVCSDVEAGHDILWLCDWDVNYG
jgi:hypothetical protein